MFSQRSLSFLCSTDQMNRYDTARLGMVGNLTPWVPAVTAAENVGVAVLPVQYFAANDRKLAEGEHRLLFAVLEDAVRCYLSGASARSREQRLRVAEAKNWFYPPDGLVQEGPFTFASICEFLGIEQKLFLRRLEALSIDDLPSTHRQSARRPALGRQRRSRRFTIVKVREELTIIR
jgi:hypothetical protein